LGNERKTDDGRTAARIAVSRAIYVIMGVAGSGKTVVGTALAR
jgi:hypothetical protein